MGCGASKKDVVDTKANGLKSPPPEKKAPAAEEPAKEADKPAIPDDKHNQDAPADEVPKTQTPTETKPTSTDPPAAPEANGHPTNPPSPQPAQPHANTQATPAPAAPTAALPPPAPAEHKKAEDKPVAEHEDKEKPASALPPNLNLGNISERKKSAIIEFDMSAPTTPSTPGKSSIQERLEKHAEERKVGVLRPSSASLERRLAEADSRRKQQAEQKVKKAKYTNELAKDKYSELREAEEKKTQELMQLIKNKNIQAATNRSQKQQEVKAKAEEDVVKARELSARRKDGGSTPHSPKTPHTPTEEDKPAASILEVPLPPLK